MTETPPATITDAADIAPATTIEPKSVPVDLGLIDAVTEEVLAHPMALSDPPLQDPPSSTFLEFLYRHRRLRWSVRRRAPSHILRDLDMLAASAERLRAILADLHANQRIDLMRELFSPRPLPQPNLLRATRTVEGLIQLLALVAANARQEYHAKGGLKTTKAGRRRKGTPKETVPPIDVEARLKSLAENWFGREERWKTLADVALTCAEYRDGLRSEPSLTDTRGTFRQARRWADHAMIHLLKFPFVERLPLLSYREMKEGKAASEPEDVPIDHPGGKARRLRALCRLLLAVGDRGAYWIEQDVNANRYGRRDMSDPAAFAITCCASLWIEFSDKPFEGRYPKEGTFSRFVEEFLDEVLGIFPASELRGALRRFHDARDDQVIRIAERLSAPPTATSGSDMTPDATG